MTLLSYFEREQHENSEQNEFFNTLLNAETLGQIHCVSKKRRVNIRYINTAGRGRKEKIHSSSSSENVRRLPKMVFCACLIHR